MEDQLLGEFVLRPPDREAETRIGEAVLVAGHVDRLHLREPEIPLEIGVQERCHETAARRVDVDRDVEPVLGVVRHHPVVDLLDGLELAGVGGAEDRDHADGVLVDAIHDGVGIDDEARLGDRYVAGLDVPVPTELLPDDLDVGAQHHVRLVRRETGGLATLAPLPLHGEAGEHHRFARSDRRHPDRVAVDGGVEQVGHDVDAPPLDLGGLRVLVLVDHVLVERLGHQLVGLGLHPCRDERRHVQPGTPVEEQFVVDEAVHGRRRRLEVGEAVLRCGPLVQSAGVRRGQLVVVRLVGVDHEGS